MNEVKEEEKVEYKINNEIIRKKSTEHVINWDLFRIVWLLLRLYGVEGWGETFQSKQLSPTKDSNPFPPL